MATVHEITPGTVYWVTGLAGSGKTTIGRSLYHALLKEERPSVFLDGDTLRSIFGNDIGYTLKARRKSAMRNARLCKALADQGLDVICATISMFHSCREWNRSNIRNYVEVYLKVPMAVLLRRDPKGLYGDAMKGKIKNVVGVDLPFEEPEDADLVVQNDGSTDPPEIAVSILKIAPRGLKR
jgi:cytidine diphosphoramidate kinase